jgi:hypothetical protein
MSDAAFRDRMLDCPALRPTVFSPGVSKRRNALRLPLLSRALLSFNLPTEPRGIKTCNQGWWRSDLMRINGFDERMEGWGREDMEMAWRAHHAGIVCRKLRYAGLAFHLHHRERHDDGASDNDIYMHETMRCKSIRCEKGIDHHVHEMSAYPLPDLRHQQWRPAVAPSMDPNQAGVHA